MVKYLIKLFYLSSFSHFSLLFTLFLPFSFKFSILFIFLLFFSVSPNTHIYINSNFTFIYEFGRITFSSFLSILDLFFFSITYPIFYLSLFFYSFICHFRSLLFQLEFHLNSNILFLLCTRVSQRTISAFDERMYTSRSINFDLRSIFFPIDRTLRYVHYAILLRLKKKLGKKENKEDTDIILKLLNYNNYLFVCCKSATLSIRVFLIAWFMTN